MKMIEPTAILFTCGALATLLPACRNYSSDDTVKEPDGSEITLPLSDADLELLLGHESARYAKRPCQKLDIVEPIEVTNVVGYDDGGSKELILRDSRDISYEFTIRCGYLQPTCIRRSDPTDVRRSSEATESKHVEAASPEEQDLYSVMLRWILSHPRRDALLGKVEIDSAADRMLYETELFYLTVKNRVATPRRKYDPVIEAILKEDGRLTYDYEVDALGNRLPGEMQTPENDGPDHVFAAEVKFDKTLERIGKLPNLQSLSLGTYVGNMRAPSLTNAGLAHVQGLTRLRKLKIGETSITDAGLVHLASLHQLESLDLEQLETTDACLKHLQSTPQLRELYLGCNGKVTDAGLAYLKGLTRLRTLVFHGSGHRITDAGMEHLKGLTQLRKLDLSETLITDAGLEHLKCLYELEDLNLKFTRVTNTGLEHLKGLTQLRKLDLSESMVMDAGLEHLKGLPRLENLNLSFTRITDTGLGHLKAMAQLRELNLSRTLITDAGIEQLKGLTHLSLDGCTGVTAAGKKKYREAERGQGSFIDTKP